MTVCSSCRSARRNKCSTSRAGLPPWPSACATRRLLHEASERLQRIPGAQVVTLTEMMGTFLNLVGAVRTLLLSIAFVAVAVSVLGVFNTLLAAVVERTNELCVMRAIGASRSQIVGLITDGSASADRRGQRRGNCSRAAHRAAELKTL